MPKRRRIESDGIAEHSSVKRGRNGPKHNLLEISDEILLRILKYLPTKDLLRAESVSRRMRSLATDQGIWKARYFETFTRPRLRRTASVTAIRDGSIDWKSRYKTKTNWSNGKAKLHKLEVASPPAPPVIAKVHNGLIFTVDPSELRAWSSSRVLRAQIRFHTTSPASCLAVGTVDGETTILVGFESGLLSLYVYEEHGRLELRLNHMSADGALMAASIALPYVMTVSRARFLSIYQLNTSDMASISVLARLQSDASFSPISVSLRPAPSGIVAVVAYAFDRLNGGCCIGLQETRLTTSGQFLESRVASTLETSMPTERTPRVRWNMSTRSACSNALPFHPQLMGAPTSLCYEHPYLIATLQDNTMMTFLVTSNGDRLEISSARRLWGHTSAISTADVNNKGKAVSISSRGHEIRVWELEPVPTGNHRASTRIEAADVMSAALARRGSGLGLALQEVKREVDLRRRWVGFDELQVVVLGETADERQIMTLYDFT
ncbi:hypothetical protein H2200_013556 [Cladophialophora chaetospira]|uniref:Probable E3 ubiquitin ligase complex SCF subunit sconB n=1 Tax=Cladophialophora chaetospira TaxID=386627 RepID=A0AA38UDU6_9EURO|nr:hypothetical protein H2200_013556 [Cladophialophora chaetospira]